MTDALCAPDLSRLSALPVERFGLDAAVVVTDIRLPLVAMGLLAQPRATPDATPAPAAIEGGAASRSACQPRRISVG